MYTPAIGRDVLARELHCRSRANDRQFLHGPMHRSHMQRVPGAPGCAPRGAPDGWLPAVQCTQHHSATTTKL